MGSTTTNSHGVSAFDFATVCGCDRLVVAPIHAYGGTFDLMTDVPDLVRLGCCCCTHRELRSLLSVGSHFDGSGDSKLVCGLGCTTRCQNICETSKVLKLKNSNLNSTSFWNSFLISQKCPTMSPHQETTAS